MARRQHFTLTVVLILIGIFSLSYLFSGPSNNVDVEQRQVDQTPLKEGAESAAKSDFSLDLDSMPMGILDGDAIAPKLENATLKAELGHATWKFLHTMMARFPDKPTKDDRIALETFMHLFARLYPCGQCASHFQKLLAQYPPQTSSRNAAAGWLCFAHNIVNERVHKPVFDCSKIGDFYDCGCGEDEKDKEKGKKEVEEVVQELHKKKE